jgi:hypothetical protein
MRLIRSLPAVAIALVIAACSDSPPEAKYVPVPALGPRIQLRVVHAINPRLPKFTRAQLDMLLAEASRGAKENYRVDIDFVLSDEITVDGLFQSISADLWRTAQYGAYELKSGRGDPDRLSETFAEALAREGDPPADLIQFGGAPLEKLKGKGYAEIGKELARIQLEGLARWRAIKAPDGTPAIDERPYNEFAFWSVLGYGGLPYDVVVTNQVVASAEYGSVEVHSALRGGMTLGLTAYNKGSGLGTYVFVSTFAVTDADPWVIKLRGGERYSEKEMPRLMAYVLVHELGHQLFHYGHPFARPECVMNPTYLLQLREWVQRMSPARCAPGSQRTMLPGATKIPFFD